MDLSVLAAVGSFMMSERVLRPKGTVVFVMGCVFIYDLTTHTHDPTSLRCYRGPGLMAFTLLCSAYCLRIWRRNGVACDELLFLPGTLHGAKHGLERHSEHEDLSSSNVGEETATLNDGNNDDFGDNNASATPSSLEMAEIRDSSNNNDGDNDANREASEGDAAAGGTIMRPRLGTAAQPLQPPNDIITDDSEATNNDNDRDGFYGKSITLLCGLYRRTSRLVKRDRISSPRGNNQSNATSSLSTQSSFSNNNNNNNSFGGNALDTTDHEYAPSGPSVLGASFDLCLPVLINFHLFVTASNQIPSSSSSSNNNNKDNNDKNTNNEPPPFNPKLLPLIFLTIIFIRTQIPPSRRKRFYTIIKRISCAPFKKVIFRDAFLADIITSFIRPLLDFIFAISYYLTAVYGAFTGKCTLDQASTKLETSWLLHNCILPASAILPLWWKFLQTLRQAYDTNKRWPYLGDAFKYLSANLVILYGMSHQEKSRSKWWIVSFVLVTMYQIVWDTVIDWDLFIFPPNNRTISSIISSPKQYVTSIQLRQHRLYKTTNFYYRIFIINTITRFTWMLCFIPAYHLSLRSGTIRPTFSRDDVRSYVSPALSAVEIVRRTLWCILKLERESIRIMDFDCYYDSLPTSSQHNLLNRKEGRGDGDDARKKGDDNDDSERDDEMMHGETALSTSSLTKEISSSNSLAMNKDENDDDDEELFLPLQNKHNDNSNSNSRAPSSITSLVKTSISLFFSSPSVKRKIFMLELSVWAMAYVALGYWSLTLESHKT